MNKQNSKFSSGYLALMLGLGVNPIGINRHKQLVRERPFLSLTEQIIKSPARLSGRWQSGQGLQWFNAR